jgi:hypothetical protein
LKSFIFSTDNDRGGVMLCDLNEIDEAVVYLQKRFRGVVKVEMGKKLWTIDDGYSELELKADNASLTD